MPAVADLFSVLFAPTRCDRFTRLRLSRNAVDLLRFGAESSEKWVANFAATTEFGTVSLNPWVEEGAGNYTLTLVPSSAPRLISGNVSGPLIRLNGADRVRIDGSTAQATAGELVGGDAALREMRIQTSIPEPAPASFTSPAPVRARRTTYCAT